MRRLPNGVYTLSRYVDSEPSIMTLLTEMGSSSLR